jgi:phosphoglycerol transferase MdoB-like AlkP superfamily enzyme
MRIYIAIGAIISWFAILLQLYLIIKNRALSIPATFVQFFSYFTILTNIIVAVYYTALLIKKRTQQEGWFTNSKTATAISVYIVIVGIVYNLVLRPLWEPQGWQLIADEILHTIIPLLFLLYWFLFVKQRNLEWKDAFLWLLYPFLYLVFVLLRGAVTRLYPYPFIDVPALGYNRVFLNCGVLFIVFFLLSLLFIAIGRKSKRA